MIHLKSQREIDLMRQAGLCVWQAHEIAAPLVVPGATTASIDSAITEYFQRCQAEPLFLDYPHQSNGRPAFPAVTCISINDEVVHGIPSDRVLREGDIVSIDTGCRLNGWCGDAARTHAVGRIDPEVQKLLDVTEATLELAVDLMRTKSTWSEVAREMDQYVSDHGFSTVECFVGHGIGRNMHEDPQVPNFLSRSLRGSGNFRIEPGLVIAVEPMVNMGTKRVRLAGDHWTQITADGRPSAHFEHTIAVTSDGPQPLTSSPSPAEAGQMSNLTG